MALNSYYKQQQKLIDRWVKVVNITDKAERTASLLKLKLAALSLFLFIVWFMIGTN